jgi:O-antigen/teichoic acid export membrane protein
MLKTGLVALLYYFNARLAQVVYLLVALALSDGLTLYVLAAISMKKCNVVTTSSASPSWRKVPTELMRFQFLGHGRQIVKSLNRYVDTVVIGHFGNPFQVGLFRSAKQIADQIQLPAQGFLVSLFPEYSKLFYAGEKERLRRLVVRFGCIFLILGLLASVLMWVWAEWIIRIILGESFLPALPTIRILLVSEVLILAMSPVYSLPASTGQAGPALWAVIAGIIIQLGMIAWLVPQHGAIGAAWANLSYYIVWSIVLMPSILKILRR